MAADIDPKQDRRRSARLALLPVIAVAAILAVPADARRQALLPRAGFLLGVNAGRGSHAEIRDLRGVASVVRVSDLTSSRGWEAAGVRVIADEAGPYTSAGVSGLDHRAYVRKVLSQVRRDPHLFAVEILNEPGGQWFWGGDSEGSVNRESYAQLLIEVHEALVAAFGVHRPLELASWDGGHDSSNAWGEAWSRNASALADVDGVTSHPYGGTGERARSILGDRELVERAAAVSHKPVYITEVGFPTAGPTSDSLRYSEAEQASAMYRFGLWAEHRGYVAAVTFFTYRDALDGGGYGVETRRGVKKLAFGALERLREHGLAAAGRAATPVRPLRTSPKR
jgi:hypothetical protein